MVMQKTKFALVIFVLLQTFCLTYAQEGEIADINNPQTIAPWQCPEGFAGQEIHVYNWSTFIAEDTIPNFEAACSVTVQYQTYETDTVVTDLIALGNPGFDLIFPDGSNVAILREAGLAVPLDYTAIPNADNINPIYLNLPFDPENQFSLPYQLSILGVGYRKSAFPEGIQSWEDVWNHDGPVAWMDDARPMLGIALKLLGYDVNTTNASEILEARDYLGEHGGNLVDIVADTEGQLLLESGIADIVVEYNGDILNLNANCECDDFAFVVPQEGALLFLTSMVIPIDAPNPELAMHFIDYILHPQVGADISNFTAFGSPNTASIEAGLILPELLSNEAIYPRENALESLSVIAIVDDEAATAYEVAWQELLTFYQD
jgi:spermidine/putrescine transport system substrate-binding protein